MTAPAKTCVDVFADALAALAEFVGALFELLAALINLALNIASIDRSLDRAFAD